MDFGQIMVSVSIFFASFTLILGMVLNRDRLFLIAIFVYCASLTFQFHVLTNHISQLMSVIATAEKQDER